MFQFIKKPKGIILTLLIAAAVVFVYLVFIKGKTPVLQTIVAQRGMIAQEVMVTGKINPAESVDLSFEKSGKVSRVNADIGDKISSGQSLVELDSSELLAQLKQNEAALQVQKSKLDELKRGSRPEEIQIKQAELQKAQQDLANDYTGVADILNDAYAKADDAVRAKTDSLFTDDDTTNPSLTFTVSDSQLEIDVKSLRVSAGDGLKKWKTELSAINSNSSFDALDQTIQNAENHLAIIRNFLEKTLDALNKTVGLSATTIDTYKTNVTAARTNVNTAYANVSDVKQIISAQKITVNKIRDELNLELAGSDPEQIAAQEAQVKQAEATVQLTQIQINKNILRSPINGVLAKQDAKVGQIVLANTPIASVISQNKFEIKANIAEADIAKVKIGDSAQITLDAYGNDVIFEAKTVSIDPAETVIKGVATYKTKLQFTEEDGRIKSGMTANITILTDKRENVIIVPQRTVITRDGNKFVLVDTGGSQPEERQVKTGLRGSDGNVEIIEGIIEGDKIVLSSAE